MLADSTFNPAAVDELACVRGGGDAVVHYGRAEAPLLSDDDDEDDDGGENAATATAAAAAAVASPPVIYSSSCSLPTFFVFGRHELNVQAVARAVVERARALREEGEVAAVVVLPDQPLSHAAGALRREIDAALLAAEAAEDASSSSSSASNGDDERKKKKRKKLPAIVVAAPAFRAVEPRAAAAKKDRGPAAAGESQASQRRRERQRRRPFDAREPARSQPLGGLTWTLPRSVAAAAAAAAPASCAFVWVGPGDDDDDEGDKNGGEGENSDCEGGGDEACSSARQLLRLSLAAASAEAGGWATVCPRTGLLRVPSPLGNRRLLGRRYFAVQKAANAALVGVVTATSAGGEKKREEEEEGEGEEGQKATPFSSSSSLPAHVAASDALVRLARAAGKRPYSLSMGRPTAAKLANFPELGAFVLVAPPGGQLPAPGTLEALAPVLTPAEAVIAWGCGKGRKGRAEGEGGEQGEESEDEEGGESDDDDGDDDDDDDDDPASRWDPSSYSLDSLPAVARAANAAAEALERRSRRRARREQRGGGSGGGGGGVARLSLVDGVSYNGASSSSFPCSTSSPPSSSSSSQLALRQDGSLAGVAREGRELTRAADFLASRRSWRGLETPATGGVPAAEAARAVEGRSGRAAGYEGEGDK